MKLNNIFLVIVMSVNVNAPIKVYKSKIESNPIKLNDSKCLLMPSVPLSNHTSYRVGGNAEWYVEPKSYEDIQVIFDWLSSEKLPLTCLGAGSNLLVSDKGISGLVLNTRYLKEYEFKEEENLVTVGAGYSLPKLTWQLAKKGWKGLEWAVGIPGSIGGAVVMNAGAHKNCMADIVKSVKIAYPDGSLAELSPEELNYSYRTSSLQGKEILVLEATLKLQNGFTRKEMMSLNNYHFNHRKNTQPYNKPSCGSVFRNPTPQAAGWLIEQIGLKGYQIGDAQVSHRHANFIINCGKATANDIFSLIDYVQEQVEYHWQILLHPEVKLLGW